MVREDALDLYGFQNQTELEFFEMLISVSGIGPKGALGILNVAPVDHLKEAIAMGDTAALTKVSGIGSKSAQKIILELRDKLGGHESETGGTMLGDERDAIEGLVALGYAERSAREALKKVPPEIKGTGARIKGALKQLGSNTISNNLCTILVSLRLRKCSTYPDMPHIFSLSRSKFDESLYKSYLQMI